MCFKPVQKKNNVFQTLANFDMLVTCSSSKDTVLASTFVISHSSLYTLTITSCTKPTPSLS